MQIIKKFYETGNIKYIAKLDDGENIVALRWWSGVGDELNENKDHYEYKNGNIQLKTAEQEVGVSAISNNPNINVQVFQDVVIPNQLNIAADILLDVNFNVQTVTESINNRIRESLQSFIGQSVDNVNQTQINDTIFRQLGESDQSLRNRLNQQGNLLTRFTPDTILTADSLNAVVESVNGTTSEIRAIRITANDIQSAIVLQQDYIDAHNARLYNLENKVFKRDKNRFLFSWLTGEFGFGFIITRQIMQPKTLTDVCGNYCLLKINLKNLFNKKWKETIYIKNIYEFRYDVQEINPSTKELEEFKDLLKTAEHNPS